MSPCALLLASQTDRKKTKQEVKNVRDLGGWKAEGIQEKKEKEKDEIMGDQRWKRHDMFIWHLCASEEAGRTLQCHEGEQDAEQSGDWMYYNRNKTVVMPTQMGLGCCMQ